jgi:hypothetical protein
MASHHRAALFATLVLDAIAPAAGRAAEPARPYAWSEEREACSHFEAQRQPLFGDAHVHTAFSFDAGGQDTRNTPRDAYRFARGERVGLQPYDQEGRALRGARIDRPLDWTAVTDHSELFGEVRICHDPKHPLHDSDVCWLYQELPDMGFGALASRALIWRQRFGFCGKDGKQCTDTARGVWKEIQQAAEEAYDRSASCRFTSFVGYEYTASMGEGINLHHNVIFKNAAVPDYAFSWTDSSAVVDLWKTLDEKCLHGIAGCDVLTIPHNSNLGQGMMFTSARATNPSERNLPITRDEAAQRERMTPLIEIMQHKGDSECLLAGDTTDEACSFEKVPYNSFAGVREKRLGPLRASLAPGRRDTVREALKQGLTFSQRIGVNPFHYGIIASTDTHLGTPGLVAEKGHQGHAGAGMNAGTALPPGLPDDLEFNPGGLAVVWAEENNRDSIFAAMKRREVYGTSGTRPVLRFFGGWSYAKNICSASDAAAQGYAGGVPMGGTLPARPTRGGAPRFAVSALRDPGTPELPTSPLAQIQIVKGWVDSQGKTFEKVFDVGGGATRASVDLATCERRGTGFESLCEVWEDPSFDASQPAFYYARVLENPSCRWTQYLCNAAKIECSNPASMKTGFEGCCSKDFDPVIQERAWSSPIWYQPAAAK